MIRLGLGNSICFCCLVRVTVTVVFPPRTSDEDSEPESPSQEAAATVALWHHMSRSPYDFCRDETIARNSRLAMDFLRLAADLTTRSDSEGASGGGIGGLGVTL
jgi:hypothetical protein